MQLPLARHRRAADEDEDEDEDGGERRLPALLFKSRCVSDDHSPALA